MNNKMIEIRINLETGETEVEAFGFEDESCRIATDPYEKALGSVTARTPKRQEERQQEKNRNKS